MQVSTLGNQLSSDHKEKIGDTVDQLNKLLDVEVFPICMYLLYVRDSQIA
jgi:hypothetical protein